MKTREFVNAQKMAIEHPKTFEAPTEEDLNSIVVGDIVKVSTGNERFWTIMTEINGDNISATGDNDLVQDENEDLTYGTVINFKKENIYDIFPKTPVK